MIFYYIFYLFYCKNLLRKLNFKLNRIIQGNSKTDIFIPRRRVHTENPKFTEEFEISRCLGSRKLNTVLKTT